MLKDPEFKREYDSLEPEFRIASELIQARLDKKLTQQQVAAKVGMTQNMIAKLESGAINSRITTISRVAGILGKELKLVGVSRSI
jgi:transcriptional regulator with XRE-family HTH domain